MSIARHHAEWLSLIEVSGPFLSMPVLLKVFPQGLDAHDPERLRSLRLAYEEWQERRADPAYQRAWVRFVLTQTLELPEAVLAEGQQIPQTLAIPVGEQGEVLRPDLAVMEGDKPRLLIHTLLPGQDLEKPLADHRWKASAATRMMELLHGTGCRLGLVTNGERWMLVDAPRGETSGFASWFATYWLEEPITLRAFRTLLSTRRFFGVSPDETLEAMLKESASNQQEVTDQLGYQVRRAVEVLIQSLDRADQDHGRQLLAHVPEEELYRAALTVMMRLVFLFSAEERGLLLLGDPLYDQHYAVSTLRAQLREAADQHGEEVLERRLDAWCRLLTTFRAVHGGAWHERLKLPAYGGKLFDPDQFPFLEGRPVRDTPLPVNNRTVLHLLEALQILQVKVPGGGPAEARRLSFRALDIEQIGHVYEGLLDHTASRAEEPYLGLLGTKDREPEVPLAELERLAAGGETLLLSYLNEQTGKSEPALRKALAATVDGLEVGRFRAACGNDEKLWERVRPFAGLVRRDTFDYPVVIPTGSVYVTEGTDRRSSGTHYTPKSLTEPIVQYTLEPLVFVGPAAGLPREQWTRRSARELLDLKICDMACGSGAFLVQACRYLAARLMEAWDESERAAQAGHQDTLFDKKSKTSTAIRITPYGTSSKGGLYEQLVPLDPDERQTYALRIVAQRCLCGVDKNPLAAEMAKLSLWLLTMAKDKPFEFLDHAIRCGDSLVGIHDLDQLRKFNLDGKGEDNTLFLQFLDPRIKEAVELRRKLEAMQANSVEDVQAQEQLLLEANEKMERLKCAADMLVGAEFLRWEQHGMIEEELRDEERDDENAGRPGPSWLKAKKATEQFRRAARTHSAIETAVHFHDSNIDAFRHACQTWLNGQPTFHWPLEFPEVFAERGGFDALVGNPPFMGGRKIRSSLGADYLDWLTQALFPGSSGNADLCAFFFRRIQHLLRKSGNVGLLATNTIAQGDTRETGLDQLVAGGNSIIRAVPSRKWPGEANLEVSQLWMMRGKWVGPFVLDEKHVAEITSFLSPPNAVKGTPHRLKENQGKSFQGSIVLGMGFVLEPEEAKQLIAKNRRNRDVLFPYLNGEDLNSRPDQSPSRWVINFFDWPLNRETAPDGYKGRVATDYPDCLAIIEERVKPERTRRNEKNEFVLRKTLPQKWWIYADKRPELYRSIAGMERVFSGVLHTKYWSVGVYPPEIVFSHALVVFASEDYSWLSVLESFIHEAWTREYSGSLETRLRYTPSDCFETFPFPTALPYLQHIGSSYHEHRSQIMLVRQQGLTKTFNRFHDGAETDADITTLRRLHVEMDQAVATAYGWADLDLDHGFHQTKQGLRYTISEAARQEVLGRLLTLNHERYAEEVKQGLHDGKGKGRKKRPLPKKTAGPTLFPGDGEEDDAAAEEQSGGELIEAAEEETADEDQSGRPRPIDEFDTDEIMAAFRQAARGQGSQGRDELLKAVSLLLGYQRIGPKIREALKGHLRAAIRRKIIEAEGELVRACAATMDQYDLEDLRGTLCSVMRPGREYERQDVIHAVARHLGFVRVTETVLQPIRSAINSAIRQGILAYAGDRLWREE